MKIMMFLCFALLFLHSSTGTAIPSSERNALIDFYNSTWGDSWHTAANWKTAGGFSAPGTECTWYGISCDADATHVTQLYLADNGLVGVLPASIFYELPNLQLFDVGTSISPTPAFPNNLSGAIPDISGLTSLQYFYIDNNQITGSIPSLAMLTNLRVFSVSSNQLTGSIPPLSGLTSLIYFGVQNNQITGSIPSLSGLVNLQTFDAHSNQLTGSIPPLFGMTNLMFFQVEHNKLTGTLPNISGLTTLRIFSAGNNRISGSIPSISMLTDLRYFGVERNLLTGSISSLSALVNLAAIRVGGNRLTGSVPSPPSPSMLSPGQSGLCPNSFTSIFDPIWDGAVGYSPWYEVCIFADEFE